MTVAATSLQMVSLAWLAKQIGKCGWSCTFLGIKGDHRTHNNGSWRDEVKTIIIVVLNAISVFFTYCPVLFR